jgi:primary-amine oxidase
LFSAEFDIVVDACKRSKMFQDKLKAIKLPEGFETVIEPWPYGAPDLEDGNTRFFQALVFARDARKGQDSNFYAYPMPLIPVMDAATKEIIRIDEPATGGKGDSLTDKTYAAGCIDHCQSAEYVPELLPNGTRKDLKHLMVVQPQGPSFSITEGNLIQWQKWRMRVTFNPREGAVVHDIRYDGRPVMYRLSISDMVSLLGNTYEIHTYMYRLSLMLILVHHTTASKPLTLVTEVLATASTTLLSAATVSVSSRYAPPQTHPLLN